MIVTARRPLSADVGSTASGWAATKKGYFVSMTNPKSIAFYGSIFALMVPAHAPLWLDIAVVALSIGISCAWYCAMALLASHPSVRRKAGLDTAAGVLVGVGGRMLAGRSATTGARSDSAFA
ncbi:threonine/homoserine/homoserine lactone efflux protein [Paraburkholderia sp. MM5496-R1]